MSERESPREDTRPRNELGRGCHHGVAVPACGAQAFSRGGDCVCRASLRCGYLARSRDLQSTHTVSSESLAGRVLRPRTACGGVFNAESPLFLADAIYILYLLAEQAR